MTLADALEAAEFLVASGRAIPADKWVDFLIAEAEIARHESLF